MSELCCVPRAHVTICKDLTHLNSLGSCGASCGGWVSSRSVSALPVSPDELNLHFASPSLSPASASATPVVAVSVNEGDNIDNYFYFKCLLPSDVERNIATFTSNASGYDQIKLKYIKLCLPVVLPLLVDLFNSSLMYSFFPSDWKRSFVTPIKKVRNPSGVKDYRPISILSVLSKILEKLVF